MHLNNRCKKKMKYTEPKLSTNSSEDSVYYYFGVEKFGPFLYGYVKWLYDSILRSGVKKVYFFARDGYMMQKAFDYIDKDHRFETQYVYFSRKSIRQALLYKAETYQEVLKYLTWERYISIGKLLEFYGFTEREIEEIAKKEKLNLEDEIDYYYLPENKAMLNLYNSLKKRIDIKSKEQSHLLSKYLDKIGMHGKCAIVDIGWHGNMQYYLETFCELEHRDISLFGYYVGITPAERLHGSANGWLYDLENQKLRKDVLCFFGVLEKLFQSSEGSTCGYQENDGIVSPQLGEYEYKGNTQIICCIVEWQCGALDYVKKAYEVNLKLDDNRDFSIPLIKFGKQPTSEDIKLFSFFYNTDGTRVYFVSNKPIWKYKPKELILACANSPWKTGFMKSAFKIPFPYYLIYRMLRK